MFLTRVREKGDAPFLWAKRGGSWQSVSWNEAARQVAALAASLKRIGLEPGDRVMLVSENRPEWLIADLGIMAAGCVTVPTYTTNTTRDHAHILGNSGARAVIVSTQKLAKTLLPAVLFESNCKHIIGMEDIRTGQASDAAQVHQWSDIVAGGRDLSEIDQRAREMKRSDLACVIYTSGTGGAPRGVMQHHGAILHNVAGATDVISTDFGWGDEIFLSFLPASHALEHTGGQHVPGRARRANLLCRKPREARRQHRGSAADDHDRRPAPVRDAADANPQERRKRRRGGQVSAAAGAEDRAGQARRQVQAVGPADGPAARAHAAQEGPRQGRRADQGVGVGRRAAQPGDRHLLPVARDHLPPGLRPDRGGAGDQRQPAEDRHPPRNRRPAAQGHRSQDRRRRRDHGPRRAGDARLLAQPGRDGAGAPGRAGWRPATSAISTTRARSSSPTARRTSSSTTRATMSRRSGSRGC